MQRRALLLQAMGLSEWRLARPHTLQGALETTVSEQVKLIVVSRHNPQSERLFSDLLRALSLTEAEVLSVDEERVQHLKLTQATDFWLLQGDGQTPPELPHAARIYRSPVWAEFKASPAAKRTFWQQIQQLPQ